MSSHNQGSRTSLNKVGHCILHGEGVSKGGWLNSAESSDLIGAFGPLLITLRPDCLTPAIHLYILRTTAPSSPAAHCSSTPYLAAIMHFTPALALALPALAIAQAQNPLFDQAQAWFDKAKSYIPTSVYDTAADPVGASASKIAAKNVTPLTMANYEAFLTPDPSSSHSPQEYMVFVSGGNKTCEGYCAKVEKEWNETASIFAADPTAPKLGYINCDTQGVLCATWMAKPPTIWHIQRPIALADQSTPASTIYINYLNITETTVGDMVALHSGKKYETGMIYEGYFHPFDGPLAKAGVNKIVGYILFGFGLIPSWAFMLIISMVSRQVM